MNLHAIPADEDSIQHFLESLWVPYHRTLERTVESHALAERDDLVDQEVDFWLDKLDDDAVRAWAAVASPDFEEMVTHVERTESEFASGNVDDGDLAGFVVTRLDPSSPVFDNPDRVFVDELYVREPYRGTGLAREFIGLAVDRAREHDFDELRLEVDVDNERAKAFYDKLEFEQHRWTLSLAVDEFEA